MGGDGGGDGWRWRCRRQVDALSPAPAPLTQTWTQVSQVTWTVCFSLFLTAGLKTGTVRHEDRTVGVGLQNPVLVPKRSCTEEEK